MILDDTENYDADLYWVSAQASSGKDADPEEEVNPATVAKWNAKLIQSVQAAVKTGRQPKIHLSRMRKTVQVLGMDDRELDIKKRVGTSEVQLSLGLSALTKEDLARLALSVLKEGDPDSLPFGYQ